MEIKKRKYSPYRNTLDTLMERIIKDENGCWIWIGSRSKFGYGQVSYKGRHWKMHRLMYTLLVGEISNNSLCCHKCDIPECCNPEHIFLGTYMDNMQDCISKDRMNPKRRRGHFKTICKNGHIFTEGNYYLNKKGCKVCHICQRDNINRFKEKNINRYSKTKLEKNEKSI